MAANSVFQVCDLRTKILEHRTELSIVELTKRIYPKWKYNNESREYYIKGKSGPHSENGSVVTRWSLSRVNYSDVDSSPLIITDMICSHSEIEQLDGLFNDSHLKMRDQKWYIPRTLFIRFIKQGLDQEVSDYFERVEEFMDNELKKKFKELDVEMTRRNESAEYVIYKNIPGY